MLIQYFVFQSFRGGSCTVSTTKAQRR